jgi:hypothetical protein
MCCITLKGNNAMQFLGENTRDDAQDIYFGQVVLIWARWFVILAAAVLALWSSDTTGELATRSLLVVALMGGNFLLHGRSLMEKPANRQLLMLSSAVDLAVVGGIVAAWGEAGLASELYVLYYPLIFAIALVFAPRTALTFAIAAVGSYAALCLVSDPDILASTTDAKILAERLITMAATAGLGMFYWRIQRARHVQAEPGTPITF